MGVGVLAEPLLGSSEQDRNRCLHEIIEAWARRTPSATAVYYEGETLTYDDLNTRANDLADHLCSLGASVGTLIGVSMKRSLEMVVAILAILKSGGAYVPLDPRLPCERLNFLVSDAPLPIILTNGNKLDAPETQVLDVRRLPVSRPLSADAGQSGVSNDDLVYVIYTSGSTGQPKGVMVPHRGVVNWLVWMRNTFEVSPTDVVLKKAPLTFDVSAWELFLPLISGARLVLADTDRQFDPRYLADLMSETRVSVAQFVPSLMRSFLEQEELPDLRSLRHVMCGGEVLTPKLQALFFKRLTSEVCNSYGPTEASIGVTRWPCRRDDQRESVPIGGPIDNTELYILDQELNPVPSGVAGELYIGGICLARGYLNRPDLTAERFLPNPFDSAGEARMYRTGDLCRFLEDGSIDFLGRIDDQVKVRGFRIELAEVEKAISEHVRVEIAAVSAEERDGEAVLCAYVVPRRGMALSERDLRGFLRTKLPLAMIPAEYLFIDALPLSPNGKIDRKALAELNTPSSTPYTSPRNDTERELAQIWGEILKKSDFSVQDDFFDCGGDSLSAIDLFLRIERRFARRICLDDLLGCCTIEALARELDGSPADKGVTGPPVGAARMRSSEDVRCRIANLADVPGIWQVCRQSFPAYTDTSLEDFRELCEHRWLNNPFRTDDDPFGWVLETAGGRIAGFHGLVPIRLWLGDRSLSAVSPTTWATEAGYGKYALRLLSEYMQWGERRFLLNTTANTVTSTIHASGAHHMLPIPLQDYDQRLLWVLDFRSLLDWKLRAAKASRSAERWLSYAPVRALISIAAPLAICMTGRPQAGLIAGLRGMRIRLRCERPLAVQSVDHFDSEFDELWDRLKGQYSVTTERSSEFLNWRHNPPVMLGRTFVLACRDDDHSLMGYAALRSPQNTAPGHFILTDLFYDEANPNALPSLMNAAFELIAAQSGSVFEVFGYHPSLNEQLRKQHPFIFRRSQLESLGRSLSLKALLNALSPREARRETSSYWYRAPNAELERICSMGSWWPSGIDGDLNL